MHYSAGPGSRSSLTEHGFTLVEAVIAIVVLAAASAGVLLIFAQATAESADPQLRAQGRAIAEAYMDEILLQRYCEDPDGGCSAETAGGGAESGESRGNFDDVFDYDTIAGESPPVDQFGNPLSGLDAYTVDVTVGGDPQAGDKATIEVRVRHDAGVLDYRLDSEREDY